MVKKYKSAAGAMGLFALAVLLVPSFDSCARKRSGNGATAKAAPLGAAFAAGARAAQMQTASAVGASAAGASAAGASAAGASAAALQPASPQTASTPGALLPGPRPAAVLAASLRAYGLGADRPIVAGDSDIGPLQDLRNARGAVKDVLAVAQAFVAGLSTGKLDTGILDPASRPALALLLAPAENPAPSGAAPPGGSSGYRLGAIELAGDSASLAIGIPQSEGPARERGRLSLGLSGGRWYVEAFVLAPEAPSASARP